MKISRSLPVLFLIIFLSFPLFCAQRMDFMLFNLNDSDNPKHDFLEMSKEFTEVMAPMFYGEAETRGSAGFEIGLGYSFTKINLDESYWKNALNDEPVSSGVPPFYSGIDLHISKGFGFGLKLFGNLRYYLLSEMISGGGGFEYAINEGIKYAPDVSIGAGYNRLFGSKDLNMQMIDLRLKISKTFVAGYQVKLTPFLAYSHLFSWASSSRLGGYFDYSQKTDGYVTDPEGSAFAFGQEFINVDRIFIGFKVVSGYFGFEIESVIPVNAGESFSLNAGFSVVM